MALKCFQSALGKRRGFSSEVIFYEWLLTFTIKCIEGLKVGYTSDAVEINGIDEYYKTQELFVCRDCPVNPTRQRVAARQFGKYRCVNWLI